MSEGETKLYVIELEPGEDMNAQWYVGISNNPERRFRTHKSGNGAVWTRRNKPVEMYVVDEGDKDIMLDLEKHLTALLMDQYGRDSTRGGGCTTAHPMSYPECDGERVDPQLATGLGETGNAKLARFADRAALSCEVHIEKEFETYGECQEWVNNELPTGTVVDLDLPGIGVTEYTSKDPEEAD